jgi:hypothetical protein
VEEGANVRCADCNQFIPRSALDEIRERNKYLRPDKPPGLKLDQGKREWHLLPWEAAEQVVDVLMFGAKKYAPDNWRHVENAQTRYLNAAIRHLLAWKRGEAHDPESGLHHLAHAACCVLFLLALEKKP